MQVVQLFPGFPLLQVQHVNQMNSLKETLPAAAGAITLIDLWMCRDVKERPAVTPEMKPGDLKMLSEPIANPARLDGFLQIMDRSLNLVYLHLHNLLMWVGQGKDLDGNPDLFQSKNLVQYKGL